MTVKVKLREKKISGNRQSLYLDFYPAIQHPETGNPTRREFLGMYLFDKTKNRVKKAQPASIRKNRQLNQRPSMITATVPHLLRNKR